MWLAVQLTPDRPTYHVPYRIRLTGALDPTALQRALQDIVDRHESLRTTFQYREGALWQVVHPAVPVELPVVDLAGHPGADLEATNLAEAQIQRRFDLRTGPLVRATLLRLDRQRHQLLLVIHHLNFDGWSATVLLTELAEAYRARAAGQEPQLAPLPTQYRDFARWQQRQLDGPAHVRSMDYWRRQLQDVPHVLRLATRETHRPHRGPAEPVGDGTHPVRVSAPVAEAVRALAGAERVTLFVAMLAGFAILLQRYTGQRDLLVGTPAAHRPRPDLEGLIGLFVNLLAVRADLTDRPTHRELLRRLQRTVLAGYEHQVPLERLLVELRPDRRQAHLPLVQAIFWLQHGDREPLRFGELTADAEELPTGSVKYDLGLGVRATGDELLCEFGFRAAALDRATVAEMAAAYLQVLERMGTEPDQPVEVVPLTEPSGPPERPATGPRQPADAGSDHAIERAIVAVWRSVLDIEDVGRHDNFFDLGGHSRLLVQVRERLTSTLDRPLSLLDLFDHPTVSTLADHLASSIQKPERPDE